MFRFFFVVAVILISIPLSLTILIATGELTIVAFQKWGWKAAQVFLMIITFGTIIGLAYFLQ